MIEWIVTGMILYIVHVLGFVAGYFVWKRRNPQYAGLKERLTALEQEHTYKKYECGEIKEELQERIEENRKLRSENILLETYVDIFIDRTKIRKAMEIERALKKDGYWW